MISEQYLSCLKRWFPQTVELAACADLNPALAQSVASTFGISRSCSPDELYAAYDIEIVLNLTNPWAHPEVNRAALEHGKHVYAEKPLALTREPANGVLELARKNNLRVGCAPDTFLGAGPQTCRRVIDQGWIGTPVAAHALIMMSHSSERYNSEQIGGALLDMAPYYVTAFVNLFGPVRRVSGMAEWPLREITNREPADPGFGSTAPVVAPMTVAGTLEFDGGVVATLTTMANGFAYLPQFEILGTEARLVANDPNMFGGPVTLVRNEVGVGDDGRRSTERSYEIPLVNPYRERNRGLGLAEMAFAIDAGRPHLATGELAYHVLDVMLALRESSADGRYRKLESGVPRPSPFVI